MADLPTVSAMLEQSSWMQGLARRLAADAHAAEDLVQETWVRALQHEPDGSRSLRGWLATVMRHRSSSDRRHGHRRQVREEVASRIERTPSTLAVVERAATHRDVVHAVLALEEPYRSTVLMRFYDGRSYGDIARAMGVSRATVNSRITRGLSRLRQRLENQYGSSRTFLGSLAPFLQRSGDGLFTLSLGAKIMNSTLGLATITALGLFGAAGLSGLWMPSDEDPQSMLAATPVLSALLPSEPPADGGLAANAVQEEEERSKRRRVEQEQRKERQDSNTWRTEVSSTFPLASTVQSLAVDTSAGDLEIVESRSGMLEVYGKVKADLKQTDPARRTQYFEDHIEIEEKDGVFYVRDAHKEERGWAVSMTVHMPGALPLNANSGAGSVVVRHAAGKVNANSGAGTVKVLLPDQPLADLNANSGAGKVVVDVLRVAKRLNANSGAGAVQFTLRDWNSSGDVSLNSGAGSVRMTIPRNFSGRLELETGMGSIRLPDALGLEVEKEPYAGSRVRGNVGSGGGRYRLNSGVGSIHVSFPEDNASEPL